MSTDVVAGNVDVVRRLYAFHTFAAAAALRG